MRSRGERPAVDRRAISEVVGAVLLLAVVVVLAGTVAYFVIGVDAEREPAPQFSAIEDYNRLEEPNGEYLNVTHKSGDTVGTWDLRLVVDGAVVRKQSTGDHVADAEVDPDYNVTDQVGAEWRADETVSLNQTSMQTVSGTDFHTDPDEYLDLREATVMVVWVPENEDRSEILFEWAGPAA